MNGRGKRLNGSRKRANGRGKRVNANGESDPVGHGIPDIAHHVTVLARKIFGKTETKLPISV